MEDTTVPRPRPALPPRSEKRNIRMLGNVMLELQNMEGLETKEAKEEEADVSRMDQEDPHELYLSSEEDVSLSDDYEDSDSLLDFKDTDSEDETEGSSSRASSRTSQQTTATVVSFTVVKPHIIDIHIPSNHTSPQLSPATRRPPPLNLQNARPMSMGTTTSYIPSYTPTMPTNASMINISSTGSPQPHGTRRSSRISSLLTSTKATFSASSTSFSASSTHAFLDSDPFAQSANYLSPPLTPTDLSIPTIPKISASQSSVWKKSISRTLSRARKPSPQKTNAAYKTPLSSSSAFSSSNINSQRPSTMSTTTMPGLTRITSNPEPRTPRLFPAAQNAAPNQDTDRQTITMVDIPVRRPESTPVTPSPREAPLRYEDLLRNHVPPPIPESTSSQQQPREVRKSFSLGMGLRGKKSVKKG